MGQNKNLDILKWLRIYLIITLAFILVACPTTDSLYREAYFRYLAKKDEEALALCQEIMARDASYTQAYILTSLILAVKGQTSKAIDVLVEAKDKARPEAVFYFNLGNLYFNTGDYTRACAEYTQALKLNSGLKEAYLNRANSFLALKEYAKALADYEDFLRLSSEERPEVRKLVELLKIDLKKN